MAYRFANQTKNAIYTSLNLRKLKLLKKSRLIWKYRKKNLS